MSRTRRTTILCLSLVLALAACGGGDDDGGAAEGSGDGPTEVADSGVTGDDDDGSGGTGVCDDLGPDAFLDVELTGAVTESVDWAPGDMDCSGSNTTGTMTLGWTQGDLDFLLRQVPIAEDDTGSGLPGTLVVNTGETSYATVPDGCSVEITTYEPAETELTHLVEGAATCGPATEIGGGGATIDIGPLRFASYALGA